MRGKEEIKKTIEEGKAVLGIEFGSTRIKAVLIDEDKSPIASGSYGWENQLVDNIWTYSMEKIQNGLQGCYQDLVKDVEAKYDVKLTKFAALGVSLSYSTPLGLITKSPFSRSIPLTFPHVKVTR